MEPIIVSRLRHGIPRIAAGMMAAWLFLAGLVLAAAPAHESSLAVEKKFNGNIVLTWSSASGRRVRIHEPHLILQNPKDKTKYPLHVILKNQVVKEGEASLMYSLSLNEHGLAIRGAATVVLTLPRQQNEDLLLSRITLDFDTPVRADITTEYMFDVMGPTPGQAMIPKHDGFLQTIPFFLDRPVGGNFQLGQATPRGGVALGMPVVGFDWPQADQLQLAASADPYCGGTIDGSAIHDGTTAGTRIRFMTRYPGSIVPLRVERRTLALEFHRRGVNGTLDSFYRTIPEIEPGAAWTHGIHLVYYDYLSENGEGWFKDLKTLADHIAPQDRGHVALCIHGWYDYFQQYAYDHEHRRLLEQWTAFPGTRKIPMSIEQMHKRMKYAKDLGFRVLLYFADGTNSDSGAPKFQKDYVLKDAQGRTSPGWKGPDSLGQPVKMDPSVPGLRDWFHGYLKALLDEYATSVDGFVWDETFYIPTDCISYGQKNPACADRAMMSLMAELTQMVQARHDRNPDLVFLASDIGRTNYALVASGTFQDSAMAESLWGPSMFANTRNCLWSCNWFPLKGAKNNLIAAEKYGLPQGLGNGWGDDCGPNRMPPALLDAVLKRFTANVKTGRERMHYLEPKIPEAKTTLRCGAFTFTLDRNGTLLSLDQAGKSILTAPRPTAPDAGSLRYGGATFPLAKPNESTPTMDGLRLTYALATQPPIQVELAVRVKSGPQGEADYSRVLTLRSRGKLKDDLVVKLPLWPILNPKTWLPGFEGMEKALGESPAAAYASAGALPVNKGTRLAIPMVSTPRAPDGQRVTITADPYFSTLFTRDAVQWTYPKKAGLENGVESRAIDTIFHSGTPRDALSVFFNTALPDVPPGPAWLHQIAMVDYDYMSDGGKGWFADIDALAAALPNREDREKVFLCLHGWYNWLGQYCLDRKTGKLADQWTAFGNYERVKTPAKIMSELRKTGVMVDTGFGQCVPVKMTLRSMHERIAYARSRGFRIGLYYSAGMTAGTALAGFDRNWVIRMGGWSGPDTPGQACILNPLVAEVRRFFLSYADALLKEYGSEIDALIWDATIDVPCGTLGSAQAPGYADRAMMTLVREVAKKVEEYDAAQGHQLALLTSDCDLASRTALVAHGTYQDSWCQPVAWPVGIFPNWRNTLWSCCWWPVTCWEWVEFGVRNYQAPVAISNGWGDNAGFAEMTPEMRRKVLDLFQWRKNRPVQMNYFSALPEYKQPAH